MARSKAIGHIIKELDGKRLKKAHPRDPSRIEFPTEAAACTAVWAIHDETGRHCANRGSIVTVYN